MANENSQDQLVSAQDALETTRESPNTADEALDQEHEVMTDSEEDDPTDIQAALDRLKVLEKGHIKLTSLIQYVCQSCHGLLHS